MDPRHAPRRSPVWPVFVAYAVALVLIFFGSAVLVFAAAELRVPGAGVQRLTDAALRFAGSAPGMLAAAAVSEGTFLGVAIVTATLLGPDLASTLRLGPTRATPVGYLAALAGTSSLSVATGSAADLAGLRGAGGTMDMIASSLAHAGPLVFVLAVLMLGVGPGIAEETFFRGLVQTRLTPRLGRWAAITVAAFLFGLAHLDRVQSPLAFLLGLFLGWSAETLGGIRPSMLAHATNNAVFVVAACSSGTAGAGPNDARGDVIGIAAGGAIFVGSAFLLRSRASVRGS